MGRIAISGIPAEKIIGEVAQTVGSVAVRHGLQEHREFEKYRGEPCTLERSCLWVPSGLPWQMPWISVSLKGNSVRIVIESRNDLHSPRVKALTNEIGEELDRKFGKDRVTVDIGY
ncbi:MAG: hypothetical protein ACU833_07050 [Gammaproteobacteria bacterium]